MPVVCFANFTQHPGICWQWLFKWIISMYQDHLVIENVRLGSDTSQYHLSVPSLHAYLSGSVRSTKLAPRYIMMRVTVGTTAGSFITEGQLYDWTFKAWGHKCICVASATICFFFPRTKKIQQSSSLPCSTWDLRLILSRSLVRQPSWLHNWCCDKTLNKAT